MPAPEHERWSEERVARELEAWFAKRCFDQWPPYSAFAADGRKRLHAALMRLGGPQRWAIELGVAFIQRHPGPQRDQTQIRDSLRVLFREHRPKGFPAERWLREHGPRGLVEQIKRTGGARHWARELGVAGPQPREMDRRADRGRAAAAVRQQDLLADQSRIRRGRPHRAA